MAPYSWNRVRFAALALALVVTACSSESADQPAGQDDLLDAEDDCAACTGKADGWTAPAEGSCEAAGILKVANTASLEELDDAAKLNRSAASGIVNTRETQGLYTDLKQLDAVPYIGMQAFKALLTYANTLGYVQECLKGTQELVLVSDLDLTVIPDHKNDYPEVLPYPGVGALYNLIELRAQGKAGDVFYVTARVPARVEQIPAWLENHGVPLGRIETGTSGMPWIAQKEKIKDITALMQERPEQKFVLFGDSSQRDPEVYHEIQTAFPGRVAAALIHKVTDDIPESRVEGEHLHADSAEAAAILSGLGLITPDEARGVMKAAREEGLSITEEEFEALLKKYKP